MSEAVKRVDRPADHASVSDIFGRLEWEMNSLADLADELQDMMGELMEEVASARTPSFLARAQKLDLLVQSLRSMAAFLSILARSAPSDWTLDPNEATGAIKLAALARRLIEDATHADENESDGDLVLF